MDYSILNVSLHHIDLDIGNCTQHDATKGDLENYIQLIVSQMLISNSKKTYKSLAYSSVTQLINSSLKDNSKFDVNSSAIAERLKDKEMEVQELIQKLNISVVRGSLLQSHFEYDNNHFYLITKIFHDKYIDDFDYKTHFGLPFKNKSVKSCLYAFDSSFNIVSIYVSETQSPSSYWSHKFLELEEVIESKKNTKNAISAIFDFIESERAKYPKDMFNIRNTVVTYLKTQELFDLEILVENYIKPYVPIDDKFIPDKLAKKMLELPSKANKGKEFDTQFSIDQSMINKRICGEYKLRNNIYLKITDSIDNYSDIIQTESISEHMFLRIAIDDKTTFNMFDKIEKEDITNVQIEREDTQ